MKNFCGNCGKLIGESEILKEFICHPCMAILLETQLQRLEELTKNEKDQGKCPN